MKPQTYKRYKAKENELDIMKQRKVRELVPKHFNRKTIYAGVFILR